MPWLALAAKGSRFLKNIPNKSVPRIRTERKKKKEGSLSRMATNWDCNRRLTMGKHWNRGECGYKLDNQLGHSSSSASSWKKTRPINTSSCYLQAAAAAIQAWALAPVPQQQGALLGASVSLQSSGCMNLLHKNRFVSQELARCEIKSAQTWLLSQ